MSTPIATGPVHHLRLTVSDVDRSRAFYTEVVGFQFVMDLPSEVLSNGAVGLGLDRAPIPAAPLPATGSMRSNRTRSPQLQRGEPRRASSARQLLDERGMPHGEVTDLGDAFGLYILAFRDLDNIQLELTAAYG